MGAGVAALIGLAAGAGLTAAVAWRQGRRDRRELHEVRRQLEKTRAARERFFDLTTHELRSPLSAILGYHELLEDGAYGRIPAEAEDAIRRIGHAARHLLNLVDGLMELSRLRTDDVRLDLEEVDLAVTFASTAEAFQALAQDRGLSASTEVPPGLPTIRSDRARLLRALDLAVTSAVRHPAEEQIHFRVALDDDTLSVHIGPVELDGVPPRSDADGQGHAVHALGLRLAVASRVAELLGGELELPDADGPSRDLRLRIATPAPL